LTALNRIDASLSRAAAHVASLKGWTRRGAAFTSGLVAALAFAPFYALPLYAAALSVLVLLLDGAAAEPRPLQASFSVGWHFGFGFFLAGLYWMAYSFFVQADEFAWMAPIAVAGLPAFLALFFGAAGAVFAAFKAKGWARIAAFAAIIMVFEFARGHVLTGLPWNLPAQALAGTAIGAQTAAYWGPYALSFVAVFLAAAPAARAREGAAMQGVAVLLAGTAALYAAGAVRLSVANVPERADIAVRIVQPNIPQREKIDDARSDENFWRHVELSRGEAAGTLYILWPENAVPFIDRSSDALRILADELPRNAILLTGTVRAEERESGGYTYYNSISALELQGDALKPVASYDKHHLVPFGEYLPFSDVLRAVGLAQLAPYDEGFAFGKGPSTLKAGPAPLAPLVCYEAIFAREIYPRGDRPQWIATVTNDAWFGDSSGPRQHLDQARLRAIESGLPVARSANTGISALIDAKGRLLARVKLYEQGRIDAALPGALPPTLYTYAGDWIFAALVLVALAFARARR
jgi:apolipoprotein N-acyltransferase